MGASSSASLSYGTSGGGGGGGGSGNPPSFCSASPSAAAPLYRAVFVEYGGRVVWDKEHPSVWESFLAGLDPEKDKGSHHLHDLHHQQQHQGGNAGTGLPPAHPAIPVMMRRNSSADSLLLAGLGQGR
jgi:hypothetical protein